MKVSRKYNKIFRGVVISALTLMLAAPAVSTAADKLIVKDSGGNSKFTARDTSKTLMLNTATDDSASWANMYIASDTGISGFTFDAYGSSGANGGGGANFRLARGTQAAKTAVQANDRIGFFIFSAHDGTAWQHPVGFEAQVEGPVATGSVPGKLVFLTGSTAATRTARMTINSSGNVGIGTTAPTYPLHMASGAYVTTGGVWTNASSREYKEDIKGLTTKEALETLEGLNPVKYAYKTDKEDKHVGFIAEDVPELVATKDRKGLSAMDIVAVLTKVVQGQQNIVQEQKNMIAELSQKVEAMQQEINRVKGNNIIGSLGANTITE